MFLKNKNVFPHHSSSALSRLKVLEQFQLLIMIFYFESIPHQYNL